MKQLNTTNLIGSLAIAACLAFTIGCGSSSDSTQTPSFSLAWSEYPSWSVFGVAHVSNLIDGAEGKFGPIEEKWNVDIVLHEADYDSCLTMYGSSQADAACLTNMDALNPALSRPSVMILPTSTSAGADACIVTEAIKSVTDLRGKKVLGLEKTVSEYCFVRNLEILGEKEADYNFSNMDPGAAAVAMQQKQDSVEAIVVWNPFAMETLNKRPDTKVLFDSTAIPNEIIDAVIVSQESLQKPGGEDFACAVIDAFYAVNQRIADPETRDDTLVALGEKFSHLDLESMKTVVKQTKFFGTPAEGKAILTGSELPEIMKKVTAFCIAHEIVEREPGLAYGSEGTGELRFDASYIDLVTAKAQ
ncbi:MAG: hypothetical protein M2R45_01845 [Verrucomicrobia subdivision 3 bacterium]|nr:hypothetical protein [Limisphaerales bacterium]MCS1415645.1 hypothetical protein [Limisphaerales bacterium]